MITTSRPDFRIRSFVRRDSRLTAAQERAYEQLWPQCGLKTTDGELDYLQTFGRAAPTFLEIGFGMGLSLLTLAKAHPENNFIGVETHKPGVGALLLGIQEARLNNLRVYHEDVIDVIEKAMPNDSLDGIQIFFPDPWQKRRHHERRLIQIPFVTALVKKLKSTGELHLATDWDDYAKHMLQVVTQVPGLKNKAGVGHYGDRSVHRPVLTKFETRAHKEGRLIWELQCCKV